MTAIHQRNDLPPTDARLDRRSVLSAGLSAVAGLAVGRSVVAQETRPVISAALQPAEPSTFVAATPAAPVVDARFPAEIAPGVFVLPDKRTPLVPNVGIVVGRNAVLVIDCGLGLESGRNVLATARRLAPGRRIVLTGTHAHPEHMFGIPAFGLDVQFVTNQLMCDYYERAGPRLLAGFRNLLPKGSETALDGLTIAPPRDPYPGDTASLDLGGRRVEFRTWGVAHSPGDQIIFLPDERVLFAGDLIEERMFPIVPLFPPMIVAADMNIGRWQAALAGLDTLQPKIVVPGHGSLGELEIARAVSDYLGTVRKQVDRAIDGGMTEEQIVRELGPAIRAQYPTWETPRFIEPALRYFARRLP